MIKFLFSLCVFSFILISCSSKDDKFCHCLELGKKLNNLSTQALQRGVDEKTAAEIKKLAIQQKQECKDYTAKNGDELMKLQESCEK
jgi:hypothetical protein